MIAHVSAQGGVFSSAQAHAAGYSPEEVQRLRRAGVWVSIRRGIYAEAGLARTAASDAGANHELAVAAACLSLRRRVVVSHASAATLMGLSQLDGPPDDVNLTWSGPKATGDYPGVKLFAASLPPRDVETTDDRPWLTRTRAARTVLDIARCEPLRSALVVADSALHLRLVTVAELQEMLACSDKWPGSRAAARVVRLADGRAETAIETIGRLVVLEQGLPSPDLQVALYDDRGFIGRADMYWKAFRTVGEIDGKLKYVGNLAGAGEDDALWREKQREDRLRDAGFEVVRMTYRQIVAEPARTAARIRAAFTRGLRAA